MKLNAADQEVIIINALYTAAEKYHDCAKAMRAEGGFGHLSIAEQFDRQVADVKAVLEILEA